jgi:hypothetical protein
MYRKFPLVLISDAHAFSGITLKTLHHHNVYDFEHTRMLHVLMIYHHTKLKGLVTAIHSLLTPNERTKHRFQAAALFLKKGF